MIHRIGNIAVYKYLKQTISNPAASADAIHASPVGYRAMIINLKIRLDTDANVADRVVSVSNYTGGDFTTLGAATNQQTASQIINYLCHASGAGYPAAPAFRHYIPLPPFPTFETGDVLRITNNGNQAGDQLRDIRILWALWPCPAG